MKKYLFIIFIGFTFATAYAAQTLSDEQILTIAENEFPWLKANNPNYKSQLNIRSRTDKTVTVQLGHAPPPPTIDGVPPSITIDNITGKVLFRDAGCC